MASIDIPLPLRNSLLSGKCVLFVGAGIGSCITGADGKHLPDGPELARQMLKDFALAEFDSDNLPSVAQIVEMRRGRKELDAYIARRFANVTPDEHVQWIPTVPWKAIFTTNYDDAIERAYSLNPRIKQSPLSISSTSAVTDWDRRIDVPVFHLHGIASAPDKSPLVITEDDYARYASRKRMLFNILTVQFATATVLYLGYSTRDSNWRDLYGSVVEEFLPAAPPRAYRVVTGSDALETEILEKRGVTTIAASVEDFIDSVRVVTATATFDDDHIANLRRGIPPDFLTAFDESPAPTARLLQNWTYLNQHDLSGPANTKDFLQGNIATWPLISAQHYFRRDIEDAVFDDMLEFATSSRATASVSILLGPARYGVSTVLMVLALRAVVEGVGRVFVHRRNATFHAGDVDFATQLADTPTFFIVAEAEAVAGEVANAVNLMRQAHRPTLFLCGDRLNEWRGARPALRGREHLVDVLSDGEIERLLEFLAQHAAMGPLEHLTREFQVATIKQKHDKQLLVIMREATDGHGRGFDAIIEDEFRHLENDVARRLYVLVCCFYHLRVAVRDQVLAELMRISLEDLYAATSASTEGVIYYESVNALRGEYAARARHQAIAEIVWERCVIDSDRDNLLLRAMETLNLNYSLDARVFEAFVRSDRDIDALSSLDAKTHFLKPLAERILIAPTCASITR